MSQFIIDCLLKTPTAKKPLLKMVVAVTIYVDIYNNSFYNCLPYFFVRSGLNPKIDNH